MALLSFDISRSQIIVAVAAAVFGCAGEKIPMDPDVAPSTVGDITDAVRQPLTYDPSTGIPLSPAFQYPIERFSPDQFGFCFGGVNDAFGGNRHLGCDTRVDETPYGTPIVAPADGIVRISTDFVDADGREGFGAYGADDARNNAYDGCLIVIEHVLQEGGQAVTSLIGHVQCESGQSYSETERRGNPPHGSIVRKGQYIGHVDHYWHGAGTTTDWHHIHFGIRRGRFTAPGYDRSPELLAYVRGYGRSEDFSYDDSAQRYRHDDWIDPIEFVEAHDDPVVAAPTVRHPSGSILFDPDGNCWQVVGDMDIAPIPNNVFIADRYDASIAVPASAEEIRCYVERPPISSRGPWTIYRRPFTNTVVIAYHDRGERFEFIRWEAYVSWGFTEADIQRNPINNGLTAEWYESFYNPEGYRLIRPGTLVKGDAESEVSMVSVDQERIPIANGDVFERLGFDWSDIVTIPQSVLSDVAGPRSSVVFGEGKMTTCAVPTACLDGVCGGGGEAEASEDGDLAPLLEGNAETVAPEAGSADDDNDEGSTEDDALDEDRTDEDQDTEDASEETEGRRYGTCDPSSSHTCPCLINGEIVDGSQICADDGLSYEPCICEAPAAPASDEGEPVEIPSTGGTGPRDLADGGTASIVQMPTGGAPAVTVLTGGTPAPFGGTASVPETPSGGIVVAPPASGGSASVHTGGVALSGGSAMTGGVMIVVQPTGGTATVPSATDAPLRLDYRSPLCGSLHVEAWWTDIAGTNRSWGPVTECVDVNSADCLLDCELPIPSGTPYFEFQVFLPNGEGYGNEDCYNGGCGAPLGELHLYRGSEEVLFDLTPNPAGPPYFNAVLAPVP